MHEYKQCSESSIMFQRIANKYYYKYLKTILHMYETYLKLTCNTSQLLM